MNLVLHVSQSIFLYTICVSSRVPVDVLEEKMQASRNKTHTVNNMTLLAIKLMQ